MSEESFYTLCEVKLGAADTATRLAKLISSLAREGATMMAAPKDSRTRTFMFDRPVATLEERAEIYDVIKACVDSTRVAWSFPTLIETEEKKHV